MRTDPTTVERGLASLALTSLVALSCTLRTHPDTGDTQEDDDSERDVASGGVGGSGTVVTDGTSGDSWDGDDADPGGASAAGDDSAGDDGAGDDSAGDDDQIANDDETGDDGPVLDDTSDDDDGTHDVSDDANDANDDDDGNDDDGNGLVRVCEPGVYECSGTELLRCASDGASREVEDTCATAALCSSDDGACQVPACDAGEFDCAGSELKECNPDRTGFDLSATCESAGLCDPDEGLCRPPACAAGAYQCDDNLLRLCNAGRTGYDTIETCEPGRCSVDPPECVDPDDIIGYLDGRLILMPCDDAPNADDCAATGWRIAQVSYDCQTEPFTYAHPVRGTAEALYDVTLHFYGILEPRLYGPSVTRDAGSQAANRDGLSPVPWAEAPPGHVPPSSNYNTYELRVLDRRDDEVAVYYLNSDTGEAHYTLLIDFEKTIRVVGGGNVHFRSHNPNCRNMKNCGSAGGMPCADKARTVDISSAEPPPLEPLNQPGLGEDDEHSGQWLFIDVVDVVPAK